MDLIVVLVCFLNFIWMRIDQFPEYLNNVLEYIEETENHYDERNDFDYSGPPLILVVRIHERLIRLLGWSSNGTLDITLEARSIGLGLDASKVLDGPVLIMAHLLTG